MAVFSKSSQEVERIIAISRVALAASSFFALWMDPAGSAWFAQIGEPLNVGYALYALALLALSYVHRSRTPEIVITQVVDIAAFLVFNYLTRGSSLFFVYLAFSMFCAALRWGWKGTVVTSSVIVVAFLVTAQTIHPADEPSEFQLNRTIIRVVYLIMAGGLLSYLGLYEARLREEIERLARWPASVGATEEAGTERILAHASQLLGAPRAVLVWELEDEPAVRVAAWSESGLTLNKHAPGEISALVPDDVASYSFFAADAGSWPTITVRDARGTLLERRDITLPPEILRPLDGSSLVSAPFRTARIVGRAFFLGVPAVSAELLPITEIVAREIGTSLDQLHLSHRLQEVAASEERIRVSRDLHDGVLQSLTGIRFELKSVADSLPAHEDDVRGRLVGLERALAMEQRELRYFIGGLKPAVSLPVVPDSLSARLEALKERLALEWNTPVSIRVDPEWHSCPSVLAQAVPLMVHEAVVNALKHARPTRVNVNVDGVSGDRLRIVVSDDGHGFPFKGRYDHRALDESRTAPRSLFDRVCALGGKMSIESSEAGSRIEMVVSL